MPPIKCFWIEPTDEVTAWLTISSPRKLKCPLGKGFEGEHEARAEPFRVHLPVSGRDWDWGAFTKLITDYDPRWPTRCECGYEFDDQAFKSRGSSRVYRNAETGEEYSSPTDAPVGAMWDAYWMPADWRGPDGRSLTVKTPGGEWCIDSRASNCTMPDDNTHKCWVRHGEPPNITVDKNGVTCGAGAGSILCGNYHGFLVNGELVGA